MIWKKNRDLELSKSFTTTKTFIWHVPNQMHIGRQSLKLKIKTPKNDTNWKFSPESSLSLINEIFFMEK